MDFREFSNSKIESNKPEHTTDEFQKKIEEEANKTMHKYANYSQNELVNEFLHIARQQLQNGELTHEKLSSIFDTLTPYLNEEQTHLFKDLVSKL